MKKNKRIKLIIPLSDSHPSKTFYFENESGFIIRFLFYLIKDEKKAWQR